jgi:hypothetical protein
MQMKHLFLFLIALQLSCERAVTQEKPRASLSAKAKEALAYNKANGLNTNYCILVDMNIHSGKKRLFVWDFKKDTVILSGLCSHGCCDNRWGSDESKDTVTFSNVPDSHCSSKGKFKLGKRGYSNWGVNINYEMQGLEKTNNNAQKREIVFHSWEEVNTNEVYPSGAPEGWGCPCISNDLFLKIDPILKDQKTPVLFWIF